MYSFALTVLTFSITTGSSPELLQRQTVRPEFHPFSTQFNSDILSCRVCNSRKYTYYFPSYLLIPPKPDSGLHRVLQRKQQQEASSESASSAEPAVSASSSSGPSPSSLHPFWSSAPADSTPEDDLARKREWRVGAADLERLREFVKKFEGSHNFHNFTVGREFGDRSNLRFMKEIRVCTIFLLLHLFAA